MTMSVETMTYEDLCRDYDRIHDIYFAYSGA